MYHGTTFFILICWCSYRFNDCVFRVEADTSELLLFWVTESESLNIVFHTQGFKLFLTCPSRTVYFRETRRRGELRASERTWNTKCLPHSLCCLQCSSSPCVNLASLDSKVSRAAELLTKVAEGLTKALRGVVNWVWMTSCLCCYYRTEHAPHYWTSF